MKGVKIIMNEEKVMEVMELENDCDAVEYDANEILEVPVSAGTIARTISQGIVFLNLILGLFGKTPLDIDESVIYTVCTGVATIGVGIWTFWKNNNFSKSARQAQLIKDGVKESV